jgi:hypothetical protein
MRRLVSLSVERQGTGEKPVVVPGERPLLPWCGEDEDSCAIRRASQQKRDAASTVPASAHGIIPLFDATVILLSSIIEVCIRPMLHIFVQHFPYCSWIGGMPIRCDPFRSVTNDSKSLLEEALGRIHIPLFTEPRINQIAIGINGPREIAPFPFDACRYVSSTYQDRLACPRRAGSQLLCNEWSKPRFPRAALPRE